MADFTKTFSGLGQKAPISDEQYEGGWASVVGGLMGIPTAEQFNQIMFRMDDKSNTLYNLISSISQQVKKPCRVASTANITLSGTQTIDDIALNINDFVLVKNQTTASQNGVYTVNTGAWTRRTDTNSSLLIKGMIVAVLDGTVGAGSLWFLINKDPIILDTTGLVYQQIPVANSVTVTNLNADMVDNKHANDTASNIPVYDASKTISGNIAGNCGGNAATSTNADMVDNKHANDTANNIPVYDANKTITGGAASATVALSIEARTTDPSSPTPGRIWLRTDL